MSDQSSSGDVYRDQFEKLGKELLDRTNRPNIITYEQFQPFIDIFNVDKEKYLSERPNGAYYRRITNLFQQYIRTLEINLYQPTIVIRSKEDRTEIGWLDRLFTRIQPDIVPPNAPSARASVPGGASPAASKTRDQQILDASFMDLMNANNTPEQNDFFAKAKIGSAIIQARFLEHNMSPEKRAEILANSNLSASEQATVESDNAFYGIVDDDDD